MRKSIMLIVVLSGLAVGILPFVIQANFVQCPPVLCDVDNGVTEESDIINASPEVAEIFGMGGDDIILGGASPDKLVGEEGNDLLLGGLGSDELIGNEGNDILLAGPDTLDFSQKVSLHQGNDTTHVLVGEVLTCLNVFDNSGNDTVNLIGFGPYTAILPFGQPGFVQGTALVVDPITGGRIFIEVEEANDQGVETINGLLSPDVVILTDGELAALLNDDPCPPLFSFPD
jgi:hypothetical protein